MNWENAFCFVFMAEVQTEPWTELGDSFTNPNGSCSLWPCKPAERFRSPFIWGLQKAKKTTTKKQLSSREQLGPQLFHAVFWSPFKVYEGLQNTVWTIAAADARLSGEGLPQRDPSPLSVDCSKLPPAERWEGRSSGEGLQSFHLNPAFCSVFFCWEQKTGPLKPLFSTPRERP